MPSKSTSASQTRRKHILIQMSQLASQIKELQDTYQQVHLQLKHLRMVAGQSQRPHKKRTRKHIHLIVQQIRTKLAQEQGMLSLQMSKRLRKKMKMLKQVAHKTPQSWKSFKYVIRRLDLAMSGLLPIELALSPAPRQSDKPRASTDASLGHYRVPSPVDRASLRSSLPLSIGVLKEATPKIRSVETSLTTLKEEPRRSQTKEKSYNHRRSRKRKSSPRPRARPKMAEVKTDSEVPQDITVKAKLESSRTPGETKTGSKESLHKPLDIMACIRSAITISMTSFISKVSVNSEVDDDLLEEDNLREDRIKKESHQRQKRPQHSPSLTYHSNIEIDTTVPEPVHEQLELNVAELREGWERYFAELEKSPMELLLEQRRNEKAALEVQRQEAQLKEAERQRRLLERQTKPWRRRRTKKMVQDDVPTSGLVPQSEKAHQEVCPECGMSFCYSEHNERPIIVTKGMINKFKYLRAG
ncbi:GL23579 [Drosophila persimilis]|uniref:GL23579 n=1 Tax=Drosophila persimilis TaxID=7234 RepID=B4G2L8_DROPE|nr:GL23579 [Drosophila persimilis]